MYVNNNVYKRRYFENMVAIVERATCILRSSVDFKLFLEKNVAAVINK